MDADITPRRDRNLSHVGNEAPERFMHGDPAPVPFGSGLPQPAFSAASSSARLCRGCLVSMDPAKLERILARRVGQLVEEALDHERRVRVAHRPRSQITGTPAGAICQSHGEVGDLIRQVGGPLDGRLVDAMLES